MTNLIASMRTRAQIQQQKYARRKAVFDALVAGTATRELWQQLPKAFCQAVKLGCLLELRPDGEFIIHPSPNNEQDVTQHDQDVEMVDAPLLTPPQTPIQSRQVMAHDAICETPHSRTGTICRFDLAPDKARISHIQQRLRLRKTDKAPSPNRFRAFFAIKDWTGSAYGNSSSPLAYEFDAEDPVCETLGKRRGTYLDSWKCAPVWDRLRKEKELNDVSCGKDPITGTTVLKYTGDRQGRR
jgi:hypothetical protein